MRDRDEAPLAREDLRPVYESLEQAEKHLLLWPGHAKECIAAARDALRALERHLSPSRPPGATISPNPGVVGMGEGEKVAQGCAEGARGGSAREMDNPYCTCPLRLRFSCPVCSGRVAESGFRMIPVLPAQEKEYQDAPTPRPSCDCPHEMGSDCATCNPDPKRENYKPDFGYDFNYDFEEDDSPEAEAYRNYRDTRRRYSPRPYPDPPLEIHVPENDLYRDAYCSDFLAPSHPLTSDKPCHPAPPPSAEPAEETSSGRESCGEGTAGGAGDWCCEMMAHYKRFFAARPLLPSHSGMWSFCPWCASPLREDGELRVGREAARPPSPEEMEAAKEALVPELTLDGEGCIQPVEGRDTCKSSEALAQVLAGKTIRSVEHEPYLVWPMTVSKIEFTDGSSLSLAGNADHAYVQEYVDSAGDIFSPEDGEG